MTAKGFHFGSIGYLEWHEMADTLHEAGIRQVEVETPDGPRWKWPHEVDPHGCGYIWAAGELSWTGHRLNMETR